MTMKQQVVSKFQNPFADRPSIHPPYLPPVLVNSHMSKILHWDAYPHSCCSNLCLCMLVSTTDFTLGNNLDFLEDGVLPLLEVSCGNHGAFATITAWYQCAGMLPFFEVV